MKALVTVVAALLSLPNHASSQEASKPIPPEWLWDGRVVVQDFNFSIGSPNPEWHWTYQQFPAPNDAVAFIAEVAPDTKYLVMVMKGGEGFSDTKRFTDGMQRKLPTGWQI